MSKKANPVLIGGFILGSLALLIAFVLIFASGSFSHLHKNMIYFDGSVNGLNIGAPVKLKGVAVGKVTDILVVLDDAHSKFITPVVIEFEHEKIFTPEGRQINGTDPGELKRLIDQGLRAQLQIQSLVTGQLYVEINFRPETPAKLMAGDNPLYPEIPSIPSPKEQLENTIEQVVSQVRNMPVQETFEALLNSILELEKLIKSPAIASSLNSLDHTLKDMQHLVHNLDEKVDPLASDLHGTLKESQSLLKNINQNTIPVLLDAQETLKSTHGAMIQAKTTLGSLDQAVGQNTALDTALKDLSSASKSLRTLADYLERHPDSLLYGKMPNGD
ncbi:MAG: MlaD family protein [Methylococcaceae bacterium]|nr:MlaD family protein [Methylococcaceae bacterium]